MNGFTMSLDFCNGMVAVLGGLGTLFSLFIKGSPDLLEFVRIGTFWGNVGSTGVEFCRPTSFLVIASVVGSGSFVILQYSRKPRHRCRRVAHTYRSCGSLQN